MGKKIIKSKTKTLLGVELKKDFKLKISNFGIATIALFLATIVLSLATMEALYGFGLIFNNDITVGNYFKYGFPYFFLLLPLIEPHFRKDSKKEYIEKIIISSVFVIFGILVFYVVEYTNISLSDILFISFLYSCGILSLILIIIYYYIRAEKYNIIGIIFILFITFLSSSIVYSSLLNLKNDSIAYSFAFEAEDLDYFSMVKDSGIQDDFINLIKRAEQEYDFNLSKNLLDQKNFTGSLDQELIEANETFEDRIEDEVNDYFDVNLNMEQKRIANFLRKEWGRTPELKYDTDYKLKLLDFYEPTPEVFDIIWHPQSQEIINGIVNKLAVGIEKGEIPFSIKGEIEQESANKYFKNPSEIKDFNYKVYLRTNTFSELGGNIVRNVSFLNSNYKYKKRILNIYLNNLIEDLENGEKIDFNKEIDELKYKILDSQDLGETFFKEIMNEEE